MNKSYKSGNITNVSIGADVCVHSGLTSMCHTERNRTQTSATHCISRADKRNQHIILHYIYT